MNLSQHTPVGENGKWSALSKAALRVILYFDFFSHPLTREEIAAYCDFEGMTAEDAGIALDQLVENSIIARSGAYYCISGCGERIRQRSEANERAVKMMRKGRFYAKLIASAPFVRGVYISGSMSKGVMYDDSDIDYFIVTKPGQLWTARTLLTLFRRTFLLNSHRYFCINYFVDEEHLLITDRDLFTATEIAFLIPMWEAHSNFIKTNLWYRRYYPNLDLVRKYEVRPWRLMKSLTELILDNALGRSLNRRFLAMSEQFWKRKYAWMDAETYAVNLQSDPGLSKHHPNRHHQRVLDAYHNLISEYETRMGCSLS